MKKNGIDLTNSDHGNASITTPYFQPIKEIMSRHNINALTHLDGRSHLYIFEKAEDNQVEVGPID